MVTSDPQQPRAESGRVRRFATFNTLNLFKDRRGPQLERYEQVAEVIAGLDADVVAVQEIIADHPSHAEPLLERLADMTGMTATVTPAWHSEDDAEAAVRAVGVGGHGFHVGLLWRRDDPGVEPIPGTLRSWGGPDFFHALLMLGFHIDGAPLRFASYHAPPFGRHKRADEMERVVAALTRPARPVLLGGDMNTVMRATLACLG